MTTSSFTRRTLLGAGLAAGAGLALSACTTGGETPGGVPSENPASQAAAVRPNYIPFDGPKPDLLGDGATGVPNGFLSYHDPPPSTGRVPLNLSKPVEMHVQSIPSATPRDRNQWWKLLEKDLGNELSVVGTDSTQYKAKFQTLIAGNTLSEITQITSVPQLPQVLEKLFTDLTPFLSGDNIKKYPNLANMPAAAWDMCMIGGKIWGLTNPRIVAGSVLMTRGDVLESKGIDLMPDLSDGQDFLDLCKELTDKSKGVFAIGQVPQNWTVPLILESLGAPNGWSVDASGNWTSAYEDPTYEKALEIVTQMWKDGVIHPNSYTDLSSTAVWFTGGATNMFAQNFASWMSYASGAITNANTDSGSFPVGAVVMPKWDGGGKAAKHLGVPGYADIVGIKKMDDEARIDELLRVGDYLASPFGTQEYLNLWYGVKGRQYNLAKGQIELIADRPNESISGPSYFGGMSAVSLYAPNKEDVGRRLFQYAQDMIPTGTKNPSYGKFSDTLVSKGATAAVKLNDLMAGIIQGRNKLTEWAAGVKTWKEEAGDAIAREYAAQ